MRQVLVSDDVCWVQYEALRDVKIKILSKTWEKIS